MTPPVAGARAVRLLEAARAAKGFMPDDEGVVLAHLAGLVAAAGCATIVEIGAYCGRSALYLAAGLAGAGGQAGAGAGRAPGPPDGCVVLSVDHHHGSEENQAGWEHHDSALVDPRTGRMDTLPAWRATIDDAGAADLVIGIVGDSQVVAAHFPGEAGLVFIDGGHSSEAAWTDYRSWAPKVADGGYLAIHDVFPDPDEGGRPPYELYVRALACGAFEEVGAVSKGSLRVLRRVRPGI